MLAKPTLRSFAQYGTRPQRKQVQAALSGFGFIAHHRKRVGRRHIPARRKVWGRPLRRDREHQLDFADIGGKANASTHDPNIRLRGRPPKSVNKNAATADSSARKPRRAACGFETRAQIIWAKN